MKRTVMIVLCALALASCQKSMEVPSMVTETKTGTGEITLVVFTPLEFETRATAITSLPSSLYWAGTSGTWKSETSKWTSTSKTVSSGKISTGYYQTKTPTAYNYYVSNNAITFATGGSTISASNETDVIAGCTQAATNSTTPSITLNHVFARTGTLTLAPSDNSYTLSGVTWKITGSTGVGTKGTYNIATGAWSSTTALSETTFTSSSDLYLIPGSYTVTVSGTMTKGDYTSSFTGSSAVTLVAGKVNNISGKITTSGATEIVLGVSLTDWGTNDITNVSFK